MTPPAEQPSAKEAMKSIWSGLRILARAPVIRRNLLTIFISLSMCVSFFFLVRSLAFGVPNNSTNLSIFSACSAKNFHLGNFGGVWKGRVVAIKLTSMIFDTTLTGANQLDAMKYANRFALYHTGWLFLIFLTSIFAFRHGLAINLLIFAALAYDFTPAGTCYFYPWDMPANFFYLLAAVLFSRERPWPMLATICIGCFFKETVLVCGLFFLFVKPWKLLLRVAVFTLPFSIYAIGKSLLLYHYHCAGPTFAMDSGVSISELLKLHGHQMHFMVDNTKALFAANWNHVIFVNAGTAIGALLAGWRRKLLPYTLAVAAYVVATFVIGSFMEFHDWMQIIPLSAIIICERLQPSDR